MVNILVVEDDKSLNNLVCTYLRASGYQTTACADGAEALSAMETAEYDLIVTDIMMPNVDGFTLAEAVRSTNENIPILFMSARDDKPSKMLGYKLGVDDYVVKPFDVDLLVMKITALLRRARDYLCIHMVWFVSGILYLPCVDAFFGALFAYVNKKGISPKTFAIKTYRRCGNPR